MISLTKDKRMLAYESLCSYTNIFHFVTTRRGGCGEGAYASFNCSHYCGDNPERVAQNRQLLLQTLPSATELVIPVQTHQTEILQIGESFKQASMEAKKEMLQGIDALITREPGYCLCVSTADCVPVLLYDHRNQAVASVHAGWRGTVASILSRTLEKMERAFGTEGKDLIACIGPSISLASFEIGEEVYDAFREKNFDMTRISIRNAQTGKHHIDLWEANRMQLLSFGIPDEQIETAGLCTYLHHNQFFSARRLGIHSGRMLSGIGLIANDSLFFAP